MAAIDPKTDAGVAAFVDAAALVQFASDVQVIALTDVSKAVAAKDDAAAAQAAKLRDAANAALKAAARSMERARDGLHGRADLPVGFEAAIDNAVVIVQKQISELPA